MMDKVECRKLKVLPNFSGAGSVNYAKKRMTTAGQSRPAVRKKT
jgi:hypothetical protein